MSSNEVLQGLKVRITIDEDGTPNPPKLPDGTIVRSLVGKDNQTYHMVRLDHPVISIRVETGMEWTLEDLVITPHFKGVSMETIRSHKDFVHLAIANVLRRVEPDDPILDFSKVAYFALGTIRRS